MKERESKREVPDTGTFPSLRAKKGTKVIIRKSSERQEVVRRTGKVIRNQAMQGLVGPGQEFRFYMGPKNNHSLRSDSQAVVSALHPLLERCLLHRRSSRTIR